MYGKNYGYGSGYGYGVTGGYDPFADTSLALWLEADYGLFQERTGASATTPASADGDPVGTWRDRRGAINGASSSDARRPVYRPTGINSRPAVEFDGTDDVIDYTSALAAAFNSKPHIYAIVAFRSAEAASSDTVFNISIGGSLNFRAAMNANANGAAGRLNVAGRRLDTDSAIALSLTPGFVGGVPQVSTGQFNYSTSDLYLRTNGAVVATQTSFQTDGNTDSTDSNTVCVGALSSSAGSGLEGAISTVMIFTPSSAFTAAQILERERYAGRRCGVAF